MSLTSLWKSDKGELAKKNIQAVVKWAGIDGKLLDGNNTSEEFREFLTNIPSEMLARYANECLYDEKFSDGPPALQDVINEVGRRLGFKVQNGLYRGKTNQIGNDGLWLSDDASAIILEVKTTATYTIDLETLVEYRKKLTAGNKVELEKSSILIVVGRNEKTDSLEAQVRGSRHAWDIRLISVEALLRLVAVKEDLETPEALQKIRQILRPKEYTKVDDIIDLVFSAAKDAKEEEKIQLELEPEEQGEKKFAPVNFREECIMRVQQALKVLLVKRSFALYSSADENTAVICLNSREYGTEKQRGYWFAFHPHQKETIEEYRNGFIALGCGSAEKLLLIPAKDFVPWLKRFHMTDLGDRKYWHVRIKNDGSKFILTGKAGETAPDASKFLLK